MEDSGEKQKLIEKLQKLAHKLEKSPTVKDVRESNLFSTEYKLTDRFGSFNEAKRIAGIEVIEENTNNINKDIQKDSDLAYLLGVLAGDGSIVELANGSFRLSLTCKDQEMLEEFTSIAEEKFGIKGSKQVQYADGKKYPRVDFCSRDFNKVLGDWSFENWHLRLRREFHWVYHEYSEDFLSGLFDAEGTVCGNRIKIYCQNMEGSRVIEEMLENLGMEYSSNKNSVYILRNSFEDFKNKINPRISRKVIK